MHFHFHREDFEIVEKNVSALKLIKNNKINKIFKAWLFKFSPDPDPRKNDSFYLFILYISSPNQICNIIKAM